MPYQLTRGQWDAISPDYRREIDGHKYFLDVNPDTLMTSLVDVEIVDVPVPQPAPKYYRDWPIDPRD